MEEEQTLRLPAALLCSLPQTPSSLGFEEGQAGILIPAPPLLTGAARLTSLESHTAHLWKRRRWYLHFQRKFYCTACLEESGHTAGA